jgi:hypothetical protein
LSGIGYIDSQKAITISDIGIIPFNEDILGDTRGDELAHKFHIHTLSKDCGD